MEFFIFICKTGIKLIVALVPWVFKYLYHYLLLSNGAISNEQMYQDQDEQNELKHFIPISPMPITREVAKESSREVSLPEVPTTIPSPLVIEQRKPLFATRRKLFRKGLLLHALMQRKDCIT